jgi:sortase A
MAPAALAAFVLLLAAVVALSRRDAQPELSSSFDQSQPVTVDQATLSPSTSTVPTTVAPTTTATTTSTTGVPTTTIASTTTDVPGQTAPPQEIDGEVTEPALPVPVAPPSVVTRSEPLVSIGRIAVPKLYLDWELYEGLADSTLDAGPSHWPGSAMPGELGNVVVIAHRVDLHHVFRHIDRLQPGDEITFTSSTGDTVSYSVTGSKQVGRTDFSMLEQSEAFTATLFASDPPGTRNGWFVVTAELIR